MSCHCGRPLSEQSASVWWCSEDCQREAASATAHHPEQVTPRRYTAAEHTATQHLWVVPHWK